MCPKSLSSWSRVAIYRRIQAQISLSKLEYVQVSRSENISRRIGLRTQISNKSIITVPTCFCTSMFHLFLHGLSSLPSNLGSKSQHQVGTNQIILVAWICCSKLYQTPCLPSFRHSEYSSNLWIYSSSFFCQFYMFESVPRMKILPVTFGPLQNALCEYNACFTQEQAPRLKNYH